MTRNELLSFTFSEDNHVNMFYMQDKVDILLNSLEEQIQGLQSLLDFKQQEISVLESKVGEIEEDRDRFNTLSAQLFVSRTKCYERIEQLETNIDDAISELEDCGWYEATDKQQTMEVLYNLKEKK